MGRGEGLRLSALRQNLPRNSPGLDVLVVDDCSVVRRILASWLSEHEWISSIRTANDGPAALTAVSALAPDVIILDLDLPGIEGIELIPRLRKIARNAAIFVCSSATRDGAAIAAECLNRGAADVIGKPESGPNAWPLSAFRRDLLLRVRALGERSAMRHMQEARARLPHTGCALSAVVIGASTGGPQALKILLPAMAPIVARVPLIVAQHVPGPFARVLANYFRTFMPVDFLVAEDGQSLKPGAVTIVPGGVNLEVMMGRHGPRAQLSKPTNARSIAPSIDLLFESAAKVWSAGTLGIILSGMGEDGLRGAKAIAKAGGRVLAQDAATSVVWSMPGAVAQAGAADLIDTPSRLAAHVLAISRGEAGK